MKRCMENKIQVFQNEEFGQVRVIQEEGKYLFCGADVAKALGYARPSKAIIDHCKGVLKRDTLTNGGIQALSYISEGDVYRLIVHSKLPSAERFEQWVYDDVLPSIRKHGAYMTDSLLEQAANNADVAAQVAKALYEERSLNKKLAGQLALTEAQLTEVLPKAAYFDALVACPDCTGVRLTAKELGVPQSMFTAYLVRKKYAYYDEKGKMHPHALPYRNGLFVVREFIAKNGHNGTQMLVTPKGRQLFQAEKAEIIG